MIKYGWTKEGMKPLHPIATDGGVYYEFEEVFPLQKGCNKLQQRCEELEKENERLKTFIAYHKLDKLYDLSNPLETEG